MFKETYEKWDKQLVKTYFIAVLILCIVEILIGIAMYQSGVVRSDKVLYTRDYIIFPSGVLLLCVLLTKFVVRSKYFSIKVKNYAVILCFEIIIFMSASVHGYFLVLTSAFFGPIIVSAIFSDLVITRVTSFASIIFMCLSFFTNRVFDHTWSLEIRILNFVVAMTIVIVFYFVIRVVVQSNIEKMDTLIKTMKEKAHLTERLKIDLQTGLYNHVEFHSALNSAVDRSKKSAVKYCLAIIDIDDFKRINDTYGHDKGDIVIGRVAERLHQMNSIQCKAYRYGGEEFALLFLNTPKEQAVADMEDLRVKLMEEKYAFMQEGCITISGGIYEFGEDCVGSEELFNHVDQALYHAKMNGKNQVRVTA